MKFSTLMSIKAVICLFFGVGEVLLPATLMSLYGATLDASGAFMAQLFGAAFILLGLLLWLMRNTTEASTVKGIFDIPLFRGCGRFCHLVDGGIKWCCQRAWLDNRSSVFVHRFRLRLFLA
jgi:hypothetical protein